MFDRFLSPGRSAIARITYNDNSFEEVPVSTIKNINSNSKKNDAVGLLIIVLVVVAVPALLYVVKQKTNQ